MGISFLSFFLPFHKVTNTFLLPSWAEAWCKYDVMLFIHDCLHGSLPGEVAISDLSKALILCLHNVALLSSLFSVVALSPPCLNSTCSSFNWPNKEKLNNHQSPLGMRLHGCHMATWIRILALLIRVGYNLHCQQHYNCAGANTVVIIRVSSKTRQMERK